jgi:two-component system, NarL family, nitrate/nitrite response regulator NarL
VKNPPERFDASPVRVAVVSRDPLAHAGLTGLLDGRADVELVEESGAQVLLWDAGAQLAGDEVRIRELAELGAPVVAVVAGRADADAALAAGARGVLLRDRIGPGLAAALLAARQGLTVLDAGLAPRPRRDRDADSGYEALTPREEEVLQLMAEGRSNKEIALALGISDHTAKFHVNAVLAKMDAGTRTEAVVTAVRRGLVLL